MNEKFNPFFINSNICIDDFDISTFDRFMNSVCGNTGNSYITYSLIKTLFGGIVNVNHIQNIYRYDFSQQDKDIDFINNECTHVFLILQDQIRTSESYGLQLPYENIVNFVKKLNKPVIIPGIGANSFNGYETDFHTKLNGRLVKFLKELSEHSKTIGIRGYFTQEVLSKLGINNTQVIGCPSFYEMGRDRIIQKKEYSKDFKPLLAGSLPNSLKKRLDIVLQDECKYIEQIAFNKKSYLVLGFKQLLSLSRKRYHVFSNIEDWKKFVSGYDFVMGRRVHGGILALNSGICSVIMNTDTRAREMTEFFKIPYHPEFSRETNIEKIYNNCDYDELNKQYPKIYDNYVEFLNTNGLEVSSIKYIRQPSLKLY